MSLGRNRHFTLIVIGDNPDEIVKPYNNNIKVEPYVVYEFAKAPEYHKKYIQYYETLLNSNIQGSERDTIKEQLDYYKSIDDIEFYIELTDNRDLDEETGNLMSTENPNGRYDSCKLGKDLSMPLIDMEGQEVFSAKKCNIDWSKIHLANQKPYEVAWDTVMEGKEPENEEEREIYETMKHREEYFNFFGDKKTYVNSSTAFWGYAVVDQKNGWYELEDNMSQNEWVINFFDRFIKNLPDDTLISIYECFRK